jgi:hypothetical protein
MCFIKNHQKHYCSCDTIHIKPNLFQIFANLQLLMGAAILYFVRKKLIRLCTFLFYRSLKGTRFTVLHAIYLVPFFICYLSFLLNILNENSLVFDSNRQVIYVSFLIYEYLEPSLHYIHTFYFQSWESYVGAEPGVLK